MRDCLAKHGKAGGEVGSVGLGGGMEEHGLPSLRPGGYGSASNPCHDEEGEGGESGTQ